MNPRLRFYLASTSPRRRELIAYTGLPWKSLAPDCDESLLEGETSLKMVRRLSWEKAWSILARAGNGRALLLGSDTTVVAPGRADRVMGKPRNESEARAMLRLLSGREHTVLTAYTLIEVSGGKAKRSMTRAVKSLVRMRQLSESSIKAYVASGEPMDKAGAYGAQELGQVLIESVQGSYSSVVGLPLAHVIRDLEESFSVTCPLPRVKRARRARA